MSDLPTEWHSSDMSRQFFIRDATPLDAAAISKLLSCAFGEFERLYTPDAYAATVLTEPGVLARIHEGSVWVVERESAIIGTGGIVRQSDSVMLRGMAVHPATRGLGVASSLLDKTERAAREDRCRQLALYTTSFLIQAIRLYQVSGFRFTGEEINPHGTKLLHMVKYLDADFGQ